MAAGRDSAGRWYSNEAAFWEARLERESGREKWYKTAIDYWKIQPPTVSGVLAGFEEVSEPDLAFSNAFIARIAKLGHEKGGAPNLGTAMDLGAGMGRVTKGCLLHHFERVDVLEPVERLLEAAATYINDSRAQQYFCVALQDYNPPPEKYDCFWMQWVSLYLTDEDFVKTLTRLKAALRQSGVVVLKDNVVMRAGPGGRAEFAVDNDDNSVMRTYDQCLRLFKKAGMEVVMEGRQPNMPKAIHPVYMFCLR